MKKTKSIRRRNVFKARKKEKRKTKVDKHIIFIVSFSIMIAILAIVDLVLIRLRSKLHETEAIRILQEFVDRTDEGLLEYRAHILDSLYHKAKKVLKASKT